MMAVLSFYANDGVPGDIEGVVRFEECFLFEEDINRMVIKELDQLASLT